MTTDMPTGKKRKYITLREICEGLEIDLPAEFEDMADEPQTLCFRSKSVKPGDVCLILRSAEDFLSHAMSTQLQFDWAVERGAKLIIMGRDAFEAFNLDRNACPVILMDDTYKSVSAFMEKLRAAQTGKVVMITGSIGKTTTKDLCYCVTKKHFDTFANTRNTNTLHKVARHLFSESYRPREVYIQEAGAGYRGSVRFAGEMLQPDVFILTNVYNHHMQVYETFENLFEDKTSGDDSLKEDGIVITNYDDENIRNHAFKHRVVSFAIEYEDADYRAVNIQQDVDKLTFDVIEKSTGEITNVSVDILGEHNAYNILAAFALGRHLGLTGEQIRQSLMEFETQGVRQKLTNIGGKYIIMDCYNVSEESIVAMLKAGDEFPLEEGGQKIALIGGENKLGTDMQKRSREFGSQLSQFHFDRILFCGPRTFRRTPRKFYGDGLDVRRGFKKVSDKPNELLTNVDQMTKALTKYVHRGDLLMAKGIFMLNMPIAVDRAFGTSFSYHLSNHKEEQEPVQEKGVKARLMPSMGQVEITKGPIEEGQLTLPDKIGKYPVHRIAEKAFINNKEVKKIAFGGSVQNIGLKAFAGCRFLRRLQIPGNVKVIEEEAFARCKRLKKVVIEEGSTHIATGAFAKCAALESIEIPDSVGMIEVDAFAESPNVVIVCREGSFAQEYAQENDIPVELKE